MPHLLTDEHNRQRVNVAKKLLQMFQTYDKKQLFANVVKGDGNWVHYFEPVRKVSNKIMKLPKCFYYDQDVPAALLPFLLRFRAF